MCHLGRHDVHCVAAAVMVALVLAIAHGSLAQAPTTGPASVPAGVTEGAKEQVSLTRPGVFGEFHMRDADLRGVLELLSRQARVNIIATKDVTGKVSAVDLYNVTFEQALAAVVKATGFAYYRDGEAIYVCTVKEYEAWAKALKKLDVRTFRLSYVTATDAKVLIAPILSPEGSAVISPASAVGIMSSSTEAGGNSYASSDVLIVKDYEDNLDRVEKVIKDIDTRPQQVLIEATILRVTLDENNALGIDFNALSGVNFTRLEGTTDGLTNMTTGTDISSSAVRGNKATFRTDFAAGVDAGGMTIGFVSNKVAFFIRALESITDTTVLANPKLLVINKQRGEVMVGSKDGYLTTTNTETTATQTVEFLETGTRLIVRPFVANDGYIRLELHPEDSSGSVETVGTSALPTETTTELTSNVLVRDGHTIVMGGLFREQTTAGRSQVPLLGNIPYLGALFRRTADDTVREEIIVLITPHIIKYPADDIVSEQVKDDVERYRIGARKGLRWWGRERLAQTYMQWAKQELRKGERDKAIWNLDMALSMLPQMIEAIRLKERLTGEAYWSEQSQYSTVKYMIQRMIMQQMGKPVELVIPAQKPRDGGSLPKNVRKALGIDKRPEEPLPGPKKPKGGQGISPTPGPVPEETDDQVDAEAQRPGVMRLTDLVKDEPAPGPVAAQAPSGGDEAPVPQVAKPAGGQALEPQPAPGDEKSGGETGAEDVPSDAAEHAEADEDQASPDPDAEGANDEAAAEEPPFRDAEADLEDVRPEALPADEDAVGADDGAGATEQ